MYMYMYAIHTSRLKYVNMINTQTLVKDKTKTYKSNPKGTTFPIKMAATGGTSTHDL